MKDFLKTTLAVICGVLILRIVGALLSLIVFAGMASLGKSVSPMPKEGVMDINLAKIALTEQTDDSGQFDFMAMSQGNAYDNIGIWDAVRAIRKAASDPAVKYILLRGDAINGGTAEVEELRDALARFRESGKPVVAYLENPGNGTYYLASVADKIYMTSYHGGTSQLLGISGRMMFLKDVLDKLGVKMQLIRHGKYKSAGETYIKSSPSEENLEQNRQMVKSIWGTMSTAMSEAREIPAERLNGMIDNLELNLPEDFLRAGLVDELMDHEALVTKLCDLAVVASEKDLRLFSLKTYIGNQAPELPGRSNVAILFADGEIVEGDSEEQISGKRFEREIDRLRKDPTVKAVVLRVNSPGGSVLASTRIRTALDLLQSEKPVVASYGNYAASGGYWISSGCDKVFSNATTLTGSIGVFSMIPEASGAAKKLGVNLVTVNSNKHSDMFSLMRPFDAAETAYAQAYVEDIYSTFVGLVAEGRSMTPEAVDEIAQGRVWTGTDALGIGLVDEIGTLSDAVAYAASLAGFTDESEYKITTAPAVQTSFAKIMKQFGSNGEEPYILSGTPFEGLGKSLSALKEGNPAMVYARMPYSIEIR